MQRKANCTHVYNSPNEAVASSQRRMADLEPSALPGVRVGSYISVYAVGYRNRPLEDLAGPYGKGGQVADGTTPGTG